MSGYLHLSAERRRAHSAGQRRIVHYCSCGKVVRGNAGWWSHKNANSTHYQLTVTMWQVRFGERL